MDAQVTQILQKSAEYVQLTQPQLDKAAAAQDAFVKRASGTIGVLVHRGIVEESAKDTVLDKLAQDHTYALALLEKLAGIVGADQVGAPSNITTKIPEDADPFVREFMPELLVNRSGSL